MVKLNKKFLNNNNTVVLNNKTDACFFKIIITHGRAEEKNLYTDNGNEMMRVV